jgi:Glycogen recognition site of AMP-activated protein kinase
MDLGKVPIPIVWPHEGSEVYVTGDFNSYSLTLLTGEKEKYCVIWSNPGICLYRFMVDGSYMCDSSKPTTVCDDIIYNFIEVTQLPQPISNLHLLSLEDLEKLDSQLFINPQVLIENKIIKIKSFLLGVFIRKRFLKIRNACIRLQSWYKNVLQLKRYNKAKFDSNCKQKKFVDVGINTENPIEVDLEKENMKLLISQLTEQYQKLEKSYEFLKNSLENKKKNVRKVDPPLISIKAFMTPSKPLSFRDTKLELTPKNKNSFGKNFKK